MKIIITENQIKLLKETLLLESDDLLTYTTKNDHRLYRWDSNLYNTRYKGYDYLVWQNVPAGTKFKFVLYPGKRVEVSAWNGKLVFSCDMFRDKDYNFFKDEALTKALKNKFCSSNENFKRELFSYVDDKNIENDLSKIQDINCVNKIKEPYKNAVNWWKNKLNEPAFYEKLKKLNNYTDQQTKEWITKYKNYLTNNISGPFCPTKSSKWYKENLGDEYAHLAGSVGSSRVVYNVIYKDETPKNIESTMVHEIQHAFYDLKPMTPDSNWKKVFPYKVWSGAMEQNSDVTSSREKSTISKYGLNQEVIKWWKEKLKLETDPSDDDPKYVCRITELSSRIVKIKNLLGYSTEDKITIGDFKKFIEYKQDPYNNSNSYYLVLCWVNNGMPDIQTFLDNLDKHVVAKVDAKNNDNMKDGVS